MQERVSACFTGDICFQDDHEVPGEIVFRSSPCSVVGDNATDIELQPMSSIGEARVPGVPRGKFYRHSKWSEFPVDPVDEVSLKGPSFDCSSVDDSVFNELKTRYSRFK